MIHFSITKKSDSDNTFISTNDTVVIEILGDEIYFSLENPRRDFSVSLFDLKAVVKTSE